MSTQKEIRQDDKVTSVIRMYNRFNSSKSNELDNTQSYLLVKKMIEELKYEAKVTIKDIAIQVLKEVLHPEQISKKPTKKEQFELDKKKVRGKNVVTN